MKIDIPGSDPIRRTQTDASSAAEAARLASERARETASSAGVAGKDQAALSDRARLLGRARAALTAVPEVRADRVADLRQRIESGAYQVPFDQLAGRLLGSLQYGRA